MASTGWKSELAFTINLKAPKISVFILPLLTFSSILFGPVNTFLNINFLEVICVRIMSLNGRGICVFWIQAADKAQLSKLYLTTIIIKTIWYVRLRNREQCVLTIRCNVSFLRNIYDERAWNYAKNDVTGDNWRWLINIWIKILLV